MNEVIQNWGGTAVVIVAVIFIIINAFDRNLASRRRTADEVDKSLITSLQATVNLLRDEQKELKVQLIDATTKLAGATAENSLLKQILQGRDDQTLKFQTEGFLAIKRSEQILEVVSKTNTSIEDLVKSLNRHFEAIENKA